MVVTGFPSKNELIKTVSKYGFSKVLEEHIEDRSYYRSLLSDQIGSLISLAV